MNTKRVLITGASSDIGLAVARVYASRGYRVLAHYRSERDAFASFLKAHPESRSIRIDFADAGATERALREHRAAIAECSVFINAAALLEPVPLEQVDAKALQHAFAINVIPGVLLTQAVAPAMAERRWGRIVHLSSIGAKFGGGASTFCYSLTKHALEFLPRNARRWASSNVLVNALRVGVTDTRMHGRDVDKDISARIGRIPIGRMATPEEIAAAVYWLGSEENGYVTGEVITAAGGE